MTARISVIPRRAGAHRAPPKPRIVLHRSAFSRRRKAILRAILDRRSMDSRRFIPKAFRFFLALLFVSCFLALPSLAASSSVPSTVPLFSDFDGDHKVDHAELFSNGAQKHIHVTLGAF